MKIKYLSLVLVLFFLTSCSQVDLSKVSDEDLERISEKAVVCNDPYIRVGIECCLDSNKNNICDMDEIQQNSVQNINSNQDKDSYNVVENEKLLEDNIEKEKDLTSKTFDNEIGISSDLKEKEKIYGLNILSIIVYNGSDKIINKGEGEFEIVTKLAPLSDSINAHDIHLEMIVENKSFKINQYQLQIKAGDGYFKRGSEDGFYLNKSDIMKLRFFSPTDLEPNQDFRVKIYLKEDSIIDFSLIIPPSEFLEEIVVLK